MSMARKSDPKKKRTKDVKKNKSTDQTDKTDDQAPPKFRFVCQLCGVCCESEKIPITITDIEHWVTDKTIYRVMHLLQLTEEEGVFSISLKTDDDGFCHMYHRDNKKCLIYDNRPLYCRSYPLEYDGDNYRLRSTECKGLNAEGMTKSELKSIRDSAYEHFIATQQSIGIIPVLYGIIFNKLVADSQQFMEKLSDEEGINVENLGELAKKLKKNKDKEND
jgi:Fe-S-cluster containining protein